VLALVAVASIVLATIAAWLHDDLEHVVGYSIVGDAGVVILALATLDTEAWAPARTWILAFVVARSAFAAWAAAVRATFWTGRMDDLRGWAIRAPLLAVALALVIIASVGFPGLAAFEARASIVGIALDGPFETFVLGAVLAPLAYYVRLLAIGVQRPDRPSSGRSSWRPQARALDVTALRAWSIEIGRLNRAPAAAVIALSLGLFALAISAGAFGLAEAAAGVAPGFDGSGPGLGSP
jgi:NADH:ubiquinone oxidoreductase subunit 2 (subunit N)